MNGKLLRGPAVKRYFIGGFNGPLCNVIPALTEMFVLQVYFKQYCRKCQKEFNPYRVEDITCHVSPVFKLAFVK